MLVHVELIMVILIPSIKKKRKKGDVTYEY